ncbi:MAG: PAS domain-containing protein, partial [Methylomonas sp.]|nr:PAS domain-containing protein [Methylomonas sp.]
IWSDNIEALLGLSDGAFNHTYEAFLDLVHPDDRKLLQQAVAACMEGKADYDVEHRIVRPDGGVRWLAGSGNVHRDAGGRAIRMLGVVRDVHEYKLAQLALAENQTHYRRLFDEAPHLILLLDSQGKILEANSASLQVLGFAPEDLQGMHTEQLLPDEQHKRLMQYLAILLQGQQIQDEPITMVDKRGAIIPVEFSAVPEIHDQQVSGARVVIRDMRDKQCPHHHHDR